MSEEEFFNRMINQISKVFDGRIATKMKNIYLKKDKQLNKQKEVLDKIKKYIEENKLPEIYYDIESLKPILKHYIDADKILELLEKIK